jgi:hypothetical protein
MRADAQQYELRTIKLGALTRETAVQEITLNFENYIMTLNYKNYYVSMTPYVVYLGQYYNLTRMIELSPGLSANMIFEPKYDNWKFSLNMSNIPGNRVANIEAVGFELIDTNIEGSNVEIKSINLDYYVDNTLINNTVNYLLFNNKIRLDFIDVLPQFTYQLNKTHIEFRNIQNNIFNRSLLIDPTILLQDADTENLGDAHVSSLNPNTNYGGNTLLNIRNVTTPGANYIFLLFNMTPVISQPDFLAIVSAELALYFETESPQVIDRNVTLHGDIPTSWNETTLTWNNMRHALILF